MNTGKQRFNLDELNELYPGLGDTVETHLTKHNQWWEFRDAKAYIIRLLNKHGLIPENIFIDRGRKNGNLEEIFTDVQENYQRISIAQFVI